MFCATVETECPCVKVSGLPTSNTVPMGFYLRSYMPPDGWPTVFEISLHQQRQVYEHEACDQFLFYHAWPADYWMFGREVGISKGRLKLVLQTAFKMDLL